MVDLVETDVIRLERLKVAATGKLSKQVLYNTDVDVAEDLMMNQLIYRLITHIYVDKLATKDYEAKASGTAEVEVPAPRGLLRPWAFLAAAFAFAGAITPSVPFMVAAAGILAVGLLIYELNPPHTKQVTVSGTVTVPIDYYNTFPDNETVYPDSLGGAVKLIQPRPAYFESC